MDKENLVKIICRWARTLGGSPFRFNTAMFHNYELWKELDINDLKGILE